eukprot:gene10177-biopygen19784
MSCSGEFTHAPNVTFARSGGEGAGKRGWDGGDEVQGQLPLRTRSACRQTTRVWVLPMGQALLRTRDLPNLQEGSWNRLIGHQPASLDAFGISGCKAFRMFGSTGLTFPAANAQHK